MNTESTFDSSLQNTPEKIDANFEARVQEGSKIGEAYADRVLATEKTPKPDKQTIENILDVLHQAQTRTIDGIVTTQNKFGNLPPTFGEFIDDETAKQEVLQAIDNFTATIQSAKDGNVDEEILNVYRYEKTGPINALPLPLRQAAFAIAYGEGPNSTQDRYQIMRQELANLPEEKIEPDTFVEQCKKQKVDFEQLHESDDVRHAAMFRLLQRAYPDIVNSIEVKMLNEMWTGTTLTDLETELSTVTTSPKTAQDLDQLWQTANSFLEQNLNIDITSVIENNPVLKNDVLRLSINMEKSNPVSVKNVLSVIRLAITHYAIEKLAAM